MAINGSTKKTQGKSIVLNESNLAENLRQIDALHKEIDETFAGLLLHELSELERITQFTERVEEKMKKHYGKIFPKKCNSCGTIYMNREDFFRATLAMRLGDTLYDEIGLQEYRNCPCGSTMLIWTSDRRDNSAYGQARRQLFDECLKKIKSISSDPEETIVARLRKVFSAMS